MMTGVPNAPIDGLKISTWAIRVVKTRGFSPLF